MIEPEHHFTTQLEPEIVLGHVDPFAIPCLHRLDVVGDLNQPSVGRRVDGLLFDLPIPVHLHGEVGAVLEQIAAEGDGWPDDIYGIQVGNEVGEFRRRAAFTGNVFPVLPIAALMSGRPKVFLSATVNGFLAVSICIVIVRDRGRRPVVMDGCFKMRIDGRLRRLRRCR